MIFLRSFFFNFFLYAGIATACIFSIPLLLIKDKYMIFAGKVLSDYIVYLLKIFLNTKVEFRGLENLKKYEKYFVASAHQSMFETFALQTVLPGPIFILKKELMKIPIFGWCLKKIGAIDIVREIATKENLNFFEKILDKTKKTNRPLLIFPQGTRVPYKDRPPFKKGVGKIYQAINLPCVPVALNSGKVWPKNSFNKYPGNITISFLNPIGPGLRKEQFLEKLQSEIYKEVDLID
jgi:1-acyl-sn-glycerol-3-phosphate acyltransferase|tara:strand:- start:22 stop:729 length:708 start_codon:yes stop_codon:yes gene_type:complete